MRTPLVGPPRKDGVTEGSRPVASNAVSERISQADVVKVARLSRLALATGDAERYVSQLSGMLEHFADIDALDLDGVEPMTQPLPLANVFRDDVLRPSLDRDEVLASAPASQEGRFRVPPMIGES